MAASKIACTSFDIGTNTTITISRDSAEYTHTITYKFGKTSGVIATKTKEATIIWSPEAAVMYTQIPNSVSGYGTLTCETYSGDTPIGTTEAKFYAYAVKADCVPEATAEIIDTNSAVVAITGSNTKFVSNVSKPEVTITAKAKNGAVLTGCQVSNDGQVGTTNPCTFESMRGKEFKIKVTDSRGYSTEISKEVDCVDYSPAYFNYLKVERTESTSETAVATIKGYCFKGNFGAADNTLGIKYRYKKDGEYTNVPGVKWNDDGTFSASANISGLNLKEQYHFEFLAEDKLTVFVSDVVLNPGTGDVRIGEDYVQLKNDLIIGDANNNEIKSVSVRKIVNGVVHKLCIGVDERAYLELRAGGKVRTRIEIKDGHLYDSLSGMAIAEIASEIENSTHGCIRLSDVLLQWGQVGITPTAANNVRSVKIKFENKYAEAPAVYIETPMNVQADTYGAAVAEVTIRLKHATTETKVVKWIAVGKE